MTDILLIIVVGILMLVSFKLGANQNIEMHPLRAIEKTIEEHKERKEYEETKKEQEEMLKKIDDYDGN